MKQAFFEVIGKIVNQTQENKSNLSMICIPHNKKGEL